VWYNKRWEDVMTTHRGADMEMRFDPEFDSIPRGSKGDGEHWRVRFRTRSLMLLVVVVGIWLALLFDPVVGPLLISVMVGVGVVVAFMLSLMTLGWFGFGLFAIGDWVIGWFQRSTRWPEP
jgi:hypothetical protein